MNTALRRKLSSGQCYLTILITGISRDLNLSHLLNF